MTTWRYCDGLEIRGLDVLIDLSAGLVLDLGQYTGCNPGL